MQISVFIGLMLSAFILSGTGDMLGRKPMAVVGAVGVTISGILSGLAGKYWHLAVLRGLVGVFMGVAFAPCVAYTGKYPVVFI